MLKPKLLIRIAAGCVLFFALGHSIGHFTRHEVTTQQEKEVLSVMSKNRFDLFGHNASYDGMYTGLSLDLIFTLIVFAFILWQVSNICTNNYKLAKQLLLPLVLCLFAFAITSFIFFFLVPAITCFVAAAFLLFALVRLNVKE